jgi:hypothetical protein
MSGVLVVVQSFGRHKKGDVISDVGEIRDSLRGEHSAHVVATQIVAPSGVKSKEG